MIDSGVAVAAVIILLVAALVHALWWGMGAAAQKHVAAGRETFEALFADLWSGEMYRRFAALTVIQPMVGNGHIAPALASALISFIRQRLSAHDRDGTGGFEDVRLALAILSARPAFSFGKGRSIDLTGIDFKGAPLFGMDFSGFRLVDCNFTGCLAMRAVFKNCDLAGTSFTGADLRGADFTGTDLSDANLINANLTGVRLGGASMVSTNISGAILVDAIGLTQEQLDSAIGDAGTAVSEQFRFVPMKSQRGHVRLKPVPME